ncbi:glycoside hydrolase family 2 [Sphingopyxis sp. JAI128]|uniref:glycoside hydrolase family 2 n=1 Tax=Sphingopyxis sp. JAI128 TaxID=2723066 RepID=UPI001618AB40|nr:glycoside hydrolase family 2 [Sphingopyxis sp. JAI128]
MVLDRFLRRAYLALAAIASLAVVAMLAVGGRPDPVGTARTLYGEWRFHPGDDPAWASPQADDADWERVTLLSTPATRDNDVGLPGLLDGWRARGHPDLEGYGWYRRQIRLPWNGELALLGPTMVDDGYQMFWNGRLVGGVGDFNQRPRVTIARPLLVRLPEDGGQTGILAIRAYLQPGFERDNHSGGLRSAPTLASLAFGERLHAAQWNRTIAGYIVEVALAGMMMLLAVIALVGSLRKDRPSFAHWLAIALITTAFLRLGNAVAAWTGLLDVAPLVWLNALLLAPLTMLGWTIAWNVWVPGRNRTFVFICAIAAWAMRVAGVVLHVQALGSAGRYVSLALFVNAAVHIWRGGERRSLALAAMGLMAVGLFITEVKLLGAPDIWFPFGIGVTLTQYVYAAALPLLCVLVTARNTRTS